MEKLGEAAAVYYFYGLLPLSQRDDRGANTTSAYKGLPIRVQLLSLI